MDLKIFDPNGSQKFLIFFWNDSQDRQNHKTVSVRIDSRGRQPKVVTQEGVSGRSLLKRESEFTQEGVSVALDSTTDSHSPMIHSKRYF